MKIRVIILLLLVLIFVPSMQANDEVKKVAILETVDKVGNVTYGVRLAVRSKFAIAITNTTGYEGYNRIDLATIMGEHEFQRTGYVSDEQIKQLGEMSGAAYILIAEVAYMDDAKNDIVITAQLIDIETTKLIEAADIFSRTDTESIAKNCRELTKRLLKIGSSTSGMTGSATPDLSTPSQSNTMQGTDSFVENVLGLNMKMVYVPGGTFTMGATAEQSGADSDEYPVHQVTLEGFYIGATEVTQAQWKAVMGTTVYDQANKAGTSDMRGVGDNYPMYYVSWHEAMMFCQELSRLTGKTYILPTEAQWEYAAREGATGGSQYSGSYSVDAVAWYDGNSSSSTHPVGTKRSNKLGIHDMSGNVYEWCSDWYGGYSGNPQTNPTGPSSGQYRVLRGGSWGSSAGDCRVANRRNNTPSGRISVYGFRVLLIP